MSTQPWRTDEWRHVGRQVRQNWKVLIRRRLDAYPVRIEWPPRVSQDKSFHRSHPEHAATELIDAERTLQVTDAGVRRARAELPSIDIYHHEAAEAMKLRYDRGLMMGQIGARLGCCERRVYELLDVGWAYVAWRLYART